MIFTSITFLTIFLPAVLLLYWGVPQKFKNTILLVASLFFYFVGEPYYILLLICCVLFAFIAGNVLLRCKTKGKKVGTFLIVGVFLGILVFYKYTGLVALPLGISFFMFQIISYVIDVSNHKIEPCKNVISFGAYITMFPQLVAGPIVRYEEIETNLLGEKKDDKILLGLERFMIGLGKKAILADTFAMAGKELQSISVMSTGEYWLLAIVFMLQIYFDFSGYSDMAIGLGHMFGFQFPENFNYPYMSRSVTEFWRRWHMTLGQWFRDYVYIPLGGNRTSKIRWIFHICIVWFLTGIWHGANITFGLWGLYFAVFMLLEKLLFQKGNKKVPGVFQHIYLLLIVLIGFVIFDSGNIVILKERLLGMFTMATNTWISKEGSYILKNYGSVIGLGMILATSYPMEWLQKWKKQYKYMKLLYMLGILLLGFISLSFVVSNSFQPFLYFRF